MPSSAPSSVVVVGAGIVGLATAWHLQERGVRVTVVDKVGAGNGASWGNAGYLAPALMMPLAEPSVLAYGARAMFSSSSPVYVPFSANVRLLRFLIGFARQSTWPKWRAAMANFNELKGESLRAYDELEASGLSERSRPADPFLVAFASTRERDAMVEELLAVVATGGNLKYDVISGDASRDIEPTLGPGVQAGLRLHGQRTIDPPRFISALAELVVSRGGEVVTGFEAVDVDDSEPSQITVRSAGGVSLAADHVVLATGASLNKLSRKFGVRAIVQAGRGYSFTVKTESAVTHPIYLPVQRIACNPLSSGLRITGMMEFRRPDAPLDARRIRAIVNAAQPMFTGIDWEDRENEWVGSRPCTTDGMPLVGTSRSQRVHVAGGHGMWGIMLGPLTGRYLAGSIVGEKGPEIFEKFNPLR